MKKIICALGILTLTCLPLMATPLYEGLQTGMKEADILKTLRKSKNVDCPPTDALLSRTGLNGICYAKEKLAGQKFALHFDFKNDELRAVIFYSDKKFLPTDNELKLKHAYKKLMMALSEKYGEPQNMPDWIKNISDGQILYMHMWKLGEGQFVYAGLGRDGGIFPVYRMSGPHGLPKSTRPRDVVKAEWDAIPDFPDLKEAEGYIQDAIGLMAKKKNKEALELFKKAADLESPRGMWGVAYLLEGGKYGVRRDLKLAKEMNEKAMRKGYALSAVKFGKTWADACRKVGMNAPMAKAAVHRCKRAADEGYASEQYNLGMMYNHGFGVPKDEQKARIWLQKAADQGDVQAKSALKKLDSKGKDADK